VTISRSQEDGIAVIQPSDTPASQSAATRWTFRRRLGLLLRTRFDGEGATLSLSDVAARTHGRLSVDELTAMLSQDDARGGDPLVYVLLAQAFDVDPDYFLTDDAVATYLADMRATASQHAVSQRGATLQRLAFLAAASASAMTAARRR
jgi:hypothetical protein